jgi:hypothetical protein
LGKTQKPRAERGHKAHIAADKDAGFIRVVETPPANAADVSMASSIIPDRLGEENSASGILGGGFGAKAYHAAVQSAGIVNLIGATQFRGRSALMDCFGGKLLALTARVMSSLELTAARCCPFASEHQHSDSSIRFFRTGASYRVL